MPKWLQSQIRRAFLEKDRYQIKLLNQCWYYYRKTNTFKQ
ncbi:cortex morphogenetic protein CmpA [Peribacillus alkalitolerans]|nr:cortex morphogenetic protein CmpA [Peribacillus alkalitolerans]